MFELLPILFPILLADIINPVLLAAVIYALGGRKPILHSIMVLAGWLVIYFGSGILIAIGLESIMQFLQNPRPIDFYIESVVAVLLIWFGIKFMLPSKTPQVKKDFGDGGSLTAVGAFGIGATINLIGMPFAIPYFAALDQILKANFGWIESLSALLIYNILYILPFIIIIFIKIFMGEKANPLLQKISSLMEKIGKYLLPIMMILIGLILIADALLFFVKGEPLF